MSRPAGRPLRVAIILTLLAVVVAAIALLSGCEPEPTTPPSPSPSRPAVLDAACRNVLVASNPGTIASSEIDELSGLSASRSTDGVYWAHNDSGDSARVFALGGDGRDLGTYVFEGAAARDWEDLAVGPGPEAGTSYLYAGDIGDNAKARSSIQVYRVLEPSVDPSAGASPPQTLSGVSTLTFVYPDGPHDAEALFVDPSSGELFIVTKELTSGDGQVFRAPADLASGSTTTLTQVATVALGLGGGVTAADVSPAGDVIALRTYFSVVLFGRPAGAPLAQAFSEQSCAGATAAETQGEALGFTRDGRGYVTASEGGAPDLHRFDAP